MSKLNVTAIIPAFNPDKKLHVILENLIQAGFNHIIVVDDGTEDKYVKFFDKIKNNSAYVFLHHNKNLGKGRALKTAFNYFLDNFPDDIGVVTIDADNQHKIKDVYSCTEELIKNPEALILGVRNFDLNVVPRKSSMGNKITSFAFRAFCGLKISDTQTGLRAIPKKFVETLINTVGERFEFETNMLLETKNLNIPIQEVKIETVYIDGNTRSNFNPLLDSFSIYAVIFKFICSSFASIICDYFLFVALSQIFANLGPAISLFIGTVSARIFSSMINFSLNKRVVFKSHAKLKYVIFKYYLLAGLIMLFSYFGIYFLSTRLYIPTIISKAITDVLLFLISFRMQIKWVFN